MKLVQADGACVRINKPVDFTDNIMFPILVKHDFLISISNKLTLITTENLNDRFGKFRDLLGNHDACKFGLGEFSNKFVQIARRVLYEFPNIPEACTGIDCGSGK